MSARRTTPHFARPRGGFTLVELLLATGLLALLVMLVFQLFDRTLSLWRTTCRSSLSINWSMAAYKSSWDCSTKISRPLTCRVTSAFCRRSFSFMFSTVSSTLTSTTWSKWRVTRSNFVSTYSLRDGVISR